MLLSLLICCVPTVSPINKLPIFTDLFDTFPAGANIKLVSVDVLTILPSTLILSTCRPCTVIPVAATVPITVLFTVSDTVSLVGCATTFVNSLLE